SRRTATSFGRAGSVQVPAMRGVRHRLTRPETFTPAPRPSREPLLSVRDPIPLRLRAAGITTPCSLSLPATAILSGHIGLEDQAMTPRGRLESMPREPCI